MKVTKGKLLGAYSALSKASLSRCEVKERIAIVKMLRSVRDEAEALNGFISDMTAKSQDIMGDPRKVAELNRAINAEADKAVETKDVERMSAETFERVIESNPDWLSSAILVVEDVFVVQ